MRDNGYDTRRRVERREQLFDIVASEVALRDVLYMEFGVPGGDHPILVEAPPKSKE